MLFDSYDGFQFMYDTLKQDITIKQTKQVVDDDLGTTSSEEVSTTHIQAPIINTQNPNVSYSNADGGQYPTTVYYLWTRKSDLNKGDEVITSSDHFKITAKADDVASGNWYYTLKHVGDDDFVS